MKVCSVCGSDVRIYNHGNDRVQYPAVIGHEMAGEIVAVGNDVQKYKIGDRVCVGAGKKHRQRHGTVRMIHRRKRKRGERGRPPVRRRICEGTCRHHPCPSQANPAARVR